MRARFRVTLNIQTCVHVCDRRAQRRAVRLEIGYPAMRKGNLEEIICRHLRML